MQRVRAPLPRRPTLILVLVVAALGLPLGVLANHQFADVPTSASYHDDVETLVGAGITAGCGGGNYCPGSAVTRGQMAQFLSRGLSRVSMSSEMIAGTGVITEDEGFVTVAEVTITVPGVSGSQFVEVFGEASASGALAGCSDICYVNARLRHAADGALSLIGFYRFPEEGVLDQDVVSKAWVFTAEPGEHTYELQVAVFNTDSTLNVSEPTLIATTHPFGATDSPTLSSTGSDTDAGTGAAGD
jgi:hypothetical protein